MSSVNEKTKSDCTSLIEQNFLYTPVGQSTSSLNSFSTITQEDHQNLRSEFDTNPSHSEECQQSAVPALNENHKPLLHNLLKPTALSAHKSEEEVLPGSSGDRSLQNDPLLFRQSHHSIFESDSEDDSPSSETTQIEDANVRRRLSMDSSISLWWMTIKDRSTEIYKESSWMVQLPLFKLLDHHESVLFRYGSCDCLQVLWLQVHHLWTFLHAHASLAYQSSNPLRCMLLIFVVQYY